MIYTVYKFRYRIGLVSIVSGLGGMTIGVIIAHFAGFPKGEVIDYFNWIPRGWLPQTIGQLMAFGASQLLLLGMVLVVWNQKELTWAKATYFAFLTWIEMSILLGIVPSEWLNLAQGPLEWTGQRDFIQFPPILFLNNEIKLIGFEYFIKDKILQTKKMEYKDNQSNVYKSENAKYVAFAQVNSF